MISPLRTFSTCSSENPAVPPDVAQTAQVRIAEGVPFVSDADLEQRLSAAGVPADQASAITEVNASARIDALRASLAVLAVLAAVALFLSSLVPREPVGGPSEEDDAARAPDRSIPMEEPT